jgi:polyphosphate kinase
VRALLRAAEAGKQVTAFVEVKARFDEASNLQWAARMEAAGVRTLYSFPDLKVHTKLALAGRRVPDGVRWYAYLGTGNFNEKTARIYADDGLFTADQRIAGEVRKIFDFLTGEDTQPSFEHLLVAPFYLRKEMYKLIENEVQAAEEGERARMILKMNAVEDDKIIRRLYEASTAGVDIEMIVRGVCCLVPGIPGQSENIRARSIVDRFLEHSRVFIFHNRGDEKVFLSSADWMNRNLSRRVEVAFPIFDPDIRREMREILQIQRRENTKARIIDSEQKNEYVERGEEDPVRAQVDTYDLLSYKCEYIEPRRVGVDRE